MMTETQAKLCIFIPLNKEYIYGEPDVQISNSHLVLDSNQDCA